MFESLIASGPQVRLRAHRYVLSASCHLVLVAAAVGLTRHRADMPDAQPVDPGILFVAPQPAHQLAAPPPDRLPDRPGPVAPSWQPDVAPLDLSLPALPSSVPAVIQLLREAAARASVLATRYRPARLRGSVVRQLVRRTLSFRLAAQGARR